MDDSPEVNHYQVLGVERTADERAIKKAYFKLVRQFPPDTHADEFKRIRAAYELLTDPIARQRFDNADKDYLEYPTEVAARLRALEKLAKEADAPTFEKALEELVADHPEVTIARENLGTHYMRTGAFDKARKTWRTLAKAAPDVPRYKLFEGIALNRLDRADDALAAIRDAHELAPQELRFHIALVDLLIGTKRYEEALEEASGALETASAEFGAQLTLEIRRLEAQASIPRMNEADATIDRLAELAAKEGDVELPKYLAAQIAGVAAKLFARRLPEQANRLLERCAAIDPASPVYHPLPHTVRFRAAELPAASTAWLSACEPGPRSPTLGESLALSLSPVGFSILASAAVLLAMYVVLGNAGARNTGDFVTELAVVPVAVLALAYAARRVLAVIRAPYGAFTTVHPLYLVRVRGERVTVHPLFWLGEVRAVHHHTNGGYTRTAISLEFGRDKVSLSLRGREYAEAWLRHLMESRGRALELMVEGYLEAEHGIETLPPALVAELAGGAERRAVSPRGIELPPASLRARRAADARRGEVRWFASAAAVAVVLDLALVATNGARGERAAFADALRVDTAVGYADYLKKHPGGRHEREARAALDARTRLRWDAAKGAPGSAPGAAVLAAALEAQRAHLGAPVAYALETELDPGARSVVEGGPFSPAANRARQDAAAGRWTRAFALAGVGEAFHVGEAREGPWVTLRVHQKVTLGAGSFGSSSNGSVGRTLSVDCEASLAVQGGPSHRVSLHVEPPDRLLVPLAQQSDGRVLARATDDALLDRALDACETKLARDLGVGGVLDAARLPAPKEKRR